MTTAERLTAVAENVKKVYEAGKAAGGLVEKKDVNFYDYDGTLLYSYTLEEAQALTELPPAPTPKYDFLVFDRWNWTLTQVNGLTNKMNIGAIYDTVDGGVYAMLDIRYKSHLTIPVSLCVYANKTVVIDWGDNSAPESFSAGGAMENVYASHAYPGLGEYTMKIVSSSNGFTLGADNYTDSFIGPAGVSTVKNALTQIYIGRDCERVSHVGLSRYVALKKVTAHYDMVAGESALSYSGMRAFAAPQNLFWGELSDSPNLNLICVCGSTNVIPGYAFKASFFDELRLPDSITSIANNALRENSALSAFRVPSATTVVPESCFNSCRFLQSVELHDGVTEIGNYAFYACEVLPEVVITPGVTKIGSYAFQYCTALKAVYFTSNTPPILSADAKTNVFSGVASDCVFYIPTASLSAYKAATNYGSIAAQMVGV